MTDLITAEIAELREIADPETRLMAVRDAIAKHRNEAAHRAQERDAMIYAGIDQFEVERVHSKKKLRCLCRSDDNPRMRCRREHDRMDMCRPHWRLWLLGIKTWRELGMPHAPRSHTLPWRSDALAISGIHNGTFQRAEAYRVDPPEGKTGYWQQVVNRRGERVGDLVRLPDPPARYETASQHWTATGERQDARMAELDAADRLRIELRNPLIRELRGVVPNPELARMAGVPRPDLYTIAPLDAPQSA